MRDTEHGKRSLFDPGALTTPAPSGSGGVSIECARCGRTSTVGVADALRRIAGLSLWIPGRTHSRRLRCPACNRRAWVKVTLR